MRRDKQYLVIVEHGPVVKATSLKKALVLARKEVRVKVRRYKREPVNAPVQSSL
jgi:hypothetical protein